MKHPNWFLIPAAIVISAQSGYAVQYLSVEQAQKELFSEADRYQAMPVEKVHVWKAFKGQTFIGTFWVDQVVGKHEFITYAVALNTEGAVKQVEIMDYRETYGYQVRQTRWRKQFIGKKASDPLMLGRDIQNISGATLSCKNVTDGVKRILATHEVVFKK